MSSNLVELFAWASDRAVAASEPVVLLALGGLFIVLSFMRVRGVRERRVSESPRPVKAAPIPDTRSPLAAHQGR